MNKYIHLINLKKKHIKWCIYIYPRILSIEVLVVKDWNGLKHHGKFVILKYILKNK